MDFVVLFFFIDFSGLSHFMLPNPISPLGVMFYFD